MDFKKLGLFFLLISTFLALPEGKIVTYKGDPNELPMKLVDHQKITVVKRPGGVGGGGRGGGGGGGGGRGGSGAGNGGTRGGGSGMNHPRGSNGPGHNSAGGTLVLGFFAYIFLLYLYV